MTLARGGAWAGGDRVASPVSVSPHDPHRLAKSSRNWRPHPLRSLAFSAGCHALVALLLMWIPAGTTQRGTRRPSTSWSSIILTVSAATTPVEWDESVERVEELAALEPLFELPEDIVEPQRPRDTFFDEPLRDEGRREVLVPTERAFEELPEDLFLPPNEVVADAPEVDEAAELAEAVEPTAAEEVPEPPPVEPLPVDPDPLPPPVDEPAPSDDAPPADVESEPAPETEGDTDDAETSGAGAAESPLLEAPAPRYPASARAQGKQGTVWLAVDVDAQGRVTQVQIKTSSGHRVLDEVARQVVLDRWKFKPRTDGETAVRRYLEPVTFKLRAR